VSENLWGLAWLELCTALKKHPKLKQRFTEEIHDVLMNRIEILKKTKNSGMIGTPLFSPLPQMFPQPIINCKLCSIYHHENRGASQTGTLFNNFPRKK